MQQQIGVAGNVKVFRGSNRPVVVDVAGPVKLHNCDDEGGMFVEAGTCNVLVHIVAEAGIEISCAPDTMVMVPADAYRGWTPARDVLPGMKLMCARGDDGTWFDAGVISCDHRMCPGVARIYEYAGDGRACLGPDGPRRYAYVVNGVAVLESRSHHYEPGAQDTNETAELAAKLDEQSPQTPRRKTTRCKGMLISKY
jgi:hypothetical protein